MKKVSLRSYSAILIAVAVIIGLFIYVARYFSDGEDWALAFAESNTNTHYTITDKNGTVLADMSAEGKVYAENESTRIACYHLIGDYAGNVGTGVLQNFGRELSGFNYITGIEEAADKTLTLTVDSELNEIAYNALAGRKGCVMLVNYKTGEVPVMVSSPSIDPLNVPEELPDGAYINRAISSTFVPGSVYKLVTLTASLDTIPDIMTRSFTCSGSIEVKGVKINCTGNHGTQTIEQALANSCNCAFGELALELGPDVLEEYSEKLGMTSSHNLDSIDTAKGQFIKDESKSADLAWSGIGQSQNLVCPYSMLRLAACIANGGSLAEPSLLGVSSGKTVMLSSDIADKLASMMNYNVTYKYGSGLFSGLNISAKTGTAELSESQASHAWFVGFIRDDEHPYAFVVLVENGGSGLSAAGSIANTVLQAAVKK